MLEKPDIQDELIAACLHDEYGLPVVEVAFLPLGADEDSAVYRVVAGDEMPYFLKLRSGIFDEVSVALPKFLSDDGIAHIMAPLASKTGQLWTTLGAFTVMLYPYVEGKDGYEIALSAAAWVNFGRALKSIHTAVLPPTLVRRIQREAFSPQARESVKRFMAHPGEYAHGDQAAAQLAAFLETKREKILDLVGRSERLAHALQARPLEFTVCHNDIHAGNLLIDANDKFHIVDWDEVIIAPKERDLMFIGGGQMGPWRSPQEEELLFYQGYGQTEVDATALAYYRYERIVQDIAAFCEQIFLTNEGGEDREQSLQYLKSNFLPNGVLEIAYRSDRTAIEG